MAKQAPNPIDVQDFQFKLHCRLKIFANYDNNTFNGPYSLVATASRFGLIFVGTPKPTFQVIQVNSIENYTLKDGEITNYNRRIISLPSRPKHLTVNCDNTKLAVVIEKDNCPVAFVYDVVSFLKQNVGKPLEIRLSATPGVNVTEASWNPTLPMIFTACKNDKTLGLYELKEAGIEVNELPTDSQSSCMCWSPKGKQIAVGSCNGTITQYKPDLKATKIINAPPLEGQQAVISIQWISNYQFIAIYKSQNSEDRTTLLVVDAPKTGENVFTNYEDICYSYGNVRPMQFYAMYQSAWNVLMVASSNSMEVGVLGNEKDSWTQWILADAARAELPLSTTKQETLPVGIAFNTSATEPVVWGETSLPPAPFLLLLSHHGLLCCFRVINIKSGVASICNGPEAVADTSGLNQFIIEDIKTMLPPPTVVLPTPTAAPPTPTATPPPLTFTPQPQTPVFTAPMKQPIIPVEKPTISPSPILKTKVPQPLKPQLVQQEIPKKNAVTINKPVTLKYDEMVMVQEETDALISKLLLEEYETLETELKILLHKARSLKVDLGTDTDDVELVRGTDALHNFLKEIDDINLAQNTEVHLLKQGLIQTWAWYEDARSRLSQTEDVGLEVLLRIQQLDPVSQRYLADIQHMIYYMESQLTQASRTLDEQWENFQDSCRKLIRHKTPTMETIYQTMVKQSAIYQKQMYILKDVSNRIRAHRSKINGPSLFASLNNIDQLVNQLKQVQLEPQHLVQVQYQKTLQNQKRLTKSKVQKLTKLLLDRDITRITIDKPQLSDTPLKSLIRSISKNRSVSDSNTILGAAVSPIAANRNVTPRVVGFVQSTPKVAAESGAPATFVKVATTIPIEVPLSPMVTKTNTFRFTDVTNTNFIPPIKPNIIFPTVSNSSPTVGMASVTPEVTTVPKIIQATTTVATPPVSFFATTKSTTPFNFGSSTTTTAPNIFSQVSSKPLPSTSTSAFVPTTQLAFNFNPKSSSTTTIDSSKSSTFVFGGTSSVFNFAAQTNTTANITTTTSPALLSFSQLKASDTMPSVTPTTIVLKENQVKIEPSSIIKTDAAISSSLPVTTTSITTTFTFTPSTPTSFGEVNTVTTSRSLLESVFSSTTTTTSRTAFLNKTKPIMSLIFDGTSPTLTISSNSIFGSTVATPTSTSVTASSVFSSTTTTVTSIFTSPVTTAVITFGPTPAASPSVATSTASTAETAASTASIFSPPVTSATPLFRPPTTTATILVTPAATTTTTSVFGTSTATTTTTFVFGTSTATTAITSIFGAATTTTTTTSIFGTPTATTTATSVFGTPTATTATTSIFGTPTATTATTPIFGTPIATTATTPIFGTPTATTITTSIFGTPTATTATTPIFGAPTTTTTTTSIFGAPTTTTATTSIFGAPTTTTTTTSIFGTPTATITTTSIFGTSVTSTTPIFGSTTTTTTTTADSVFGSTPAQSIFSATATSIFGSNVLTTTQSMFGSTDTTTTSIFGAQPPQTTSVAATTTVASNFGFATPVATTPSAFGTSTSTNTIFGAATTAFLQTTTAPSLFTASTSSIFSASPNKTTSTLGPFATTTTAATNAFGSDTTASGSLFGQSATFGNQSIFGAPVSTSSNLFGGSAANSTFGSGGSVFGAPSTTSNVFGQSQASAFGFATAAANIPTTNSGFGFSKPSSPFGFAAATTTNSNSFNFGGLDIGSATTTTANSGFGSLFGQPSNNPFAKADDKQKSPFGGGGLFGTPAPTTTTSIFGGGSSSGFGSPSTPAFGSSTAFGSPSGFGSQQSSFGQTSFGGGGIFANTAQAGPFSAGNQSVAQSGFGGFGQAQKPSGFGAPPVFSGSPGGFGAPPAFGSGNTSFGSASAFGSSPSKIFGGPGDDSGSFGAAPQQNSTFANLATQNTLGFGSLAQQSSTTSQSQPFSSGSSFSTWR